MKTKKAIVAACFAVVAAGSAAAANFPDADGSHDIASPAAWGGTLPSATEDVVFTNWSSKTIYAGSDVTFGKLVNSQRGGAPGLSRTASAPTTC